MASTCDISEYLTAVADAFSEGGAISLRIPKYVVRKEQVSYANDIAKVCAFKTKNINGKRSAIGMIEGETGVGKTLGYIIPALLHNAMTGERVLISTFSLHLMKQVIDTMKLAQDVCSDITGVRPRFGIMKGWCNFIDPARARQMSEKTVGKISEQLLRAATWAEHEYAWAAENNSAMLTANRMPGDIEAFKEVYELDGMDTRDICYTGFDETQLGCNVIKSYLSENANAGVVITNHALLALSAACWSRLLPNFDVVIADEADALPDAAESIISGNLSLNNLAKNAKNLRESVSTAGKYIDSVVSICLLFSQLFDDNKKIATKSPKGFHILLNDPDLYIETIDYIINMVQQLNISLKGIKTQARNRDVDLATIEEGISKTEKFLLAVKDDKRATGQTAIAWSPVRNYPSLHVSSTNPGRIFSNLWRECKTKATGEISTRVKKVILTSATLEAPDSQRTKAFRSLKAELGIYNEKNIFTGKHVPHHFGEITGITLSDPQAPNPSIKNDKTGNFETSPEWLDYCTSLIKRANTRQNGVGGGRVLVLALSHKDGKELGERLPGSFVHHAGEKIKDAVELFKASDNGVMITAGGWAGLDLPGLVENLVITRIPMFPVDEIKEAMIAQKLRQQGKEDKSFSIVMAMMMQKASITLRQGFGRGIRDDNDKVHVWIADPRFPMPDDIMINMAESGAIKYKKQDAAFKRFHHCIPDRFRQGKNSVANNPFVFTCEGKLAKCEGDE